MPRPRATDPPVIFPPRPSCRNPPPRRKPRERSDEIEGSRDESMSVVSRSPSPARRARSSTRPAPARYARCASTPKSSCWRPRPATGPSSSTTSSPWTCSRSRRRTPVPRGELRVGRGGAGVGGWGGGSLVRPPACLAPATWANATGEEPRDAKGASSTGNNVIIVSIWLGKVGANERLGPA